MVLCTILGVVLTKEQRTTPVEEISIVVDSIKKHNDSITVAINKLDSIRDAKIIEITTINNDSVVKLFYELVKEP